MYLNEWRQFPRDFRRRFSRVYREHQHDPYWRPTCHWCGISLTRQTATVDHVHALGEGGRNTLDNVVPACVDCNSRRSSHTSWLSHCTGAMQRYWFALEHGCTPAEASDFASAAGPVTHAALHRRLAWFHSPEYGQFAS